ncbi:flavodoxin domain-containing protein [Paraclostridium bifermentans]|uniref:flavodoxin domain-containing protein n=1 Tax=Paraclostridium bifermentans TaxID=1490 RepID=UPI001C7F5EE1|nr:flavodoxin domain-containing protein [Paraclostridium bifermentans]GIM33778.1 flavodoxin [Paraclostridium bifermentans subsp. muricolitidis]
MSKEIAVIYKTKYGSTKKYAGWIALKLDADLYEISDIRSKHLDEYETIIFGGGIYRGKINGLNFIDQNYNKIKDKNIYIFSVGMESISENRKESLIKNNFKNIEEKNVGFYNFKGGLDYSSLSFIDKIMMKALKSMIDKKTKSDLTEDDKVVLRGFEEKIDLTDKKSIKELIDKINSYKSANDN